MPSTAASSTSSRGGHSYKSMEATSARLRHHSCHRANAGSRQGTGRLLPVIPVSPTPCSDAVAVTVAVKRPVWTEQMGHPRCSEVVVRGRGRTADLPLFRIKDDRPGLAMMVSRPAQGPAADRDGPRYTNMYETRNE